ncbi:hypothetical protein [Nitrosospira briensis]|uniref:hypothetical protein n=1 Tax=Nitrosospira briensis TaxID=35799 RepID=UPI0015A580E7|nr:hypothetical protein [Nitrosospira briensis]
MNTRPQVRYARRYIPPLVDQRLDRFGEKKHDGPNCMLLYFCCASVRLWNGH